MATTPPPVPAIFDFLPYPTWRGTPNLFLPKWPQRMYFRLRRWFWSLSFWFFEGKNLEGNHPPPSPVRQGLIVYKLYRKENIFFVRTPNPLENVFKLSIKVFHQGIAHTTFSSQTCSSCQCALHNHIEVLNRQTSNIFHYSYFFIKSLN